MHIHLNTHIQLLILWHIARNTYKYAEIVTYMQIFVYYIVLTYIKRQVCKDLTISKPKYLGT